MLRRALTVLFFLNGWFVNAACADTTREAAAQLYNQVYLGSNGVAPQWNGNIDAGNPGTVSAAYLTAVQQRVNYFRIMAGLPGNVTLRDDLNQKCAQAALMFSANNDLSHSPPTSWHFYTAAGAQAAGHSNISFGVAGPSAINAFISDSGLTSLGHRRWILFPPQLQMGAGMVFPQQTYYPAMSLWVIGSTSDGSWSTTRPASPPFVAWPPPGFTPYQVLYALWSFSIPSADFSGASVSLTKNGQPVAVTVYPQSNGYGDNTLVWLPAGQTGAPASGDTTYVVNINNVRIGGVARNYNYTVTAFDPTQVPTCPADFNHDGVANNDDLFAFIELFFSGTGTIADLAGFIAAWLRGCV